MPKTISPNVQAFITALDEMLKPKPIDISLNKEHAILLLEGLGKLSKDKQKGVVYDGLKKNLENIISIWERKIKNQKILNSKSLPTK